MEKIKTYNVECRDSRVGGYVCAFQVQADNWRQAREIAGTKCWHIKAHGKKSIRLAD